MWETPKKTRSGVLITDSVIPSITEALISFSPNYGTYCPVKVNPKDSQSLPQRIKSKINKRLGVTKWNSPSKLYTQKTDYQKFLHELYGSELLVTGRFHAVTMALATQTPFIAISSNTHKIKSTVQDALGSTLRVKSDIEAVSSALAEDFSEFATYSTAERTALDRYNTKAKKLVDDMFVTISEML